MSQKPIDRSNDYHPLDYSQNGASEPVDAVNALAPSAAPPQPTPVNPVPAREEPAHSVPPGASGGRARSASVSATMPAASDVPGSNVSHPSSSAASGAGSTVLGGPATHAPAVQPLSIATTAQNAPPTQPGPFSTLPGHSRTPSIAPSRSRAPSSASSTGRVNSVAHTPVAALMRPPTVRPASGNAGAYGQSGAAAAAAGAPARLASRPPSSAGLRPPSSHVGPPLPTLAEVNRPPSRASISSDVFGDLSARAAYWRKRMKEAPLSASQRLRAFDLCEALEDAPLGRDITRVEQELQELLSTFESTVQQPRQAPPVDQTPPPPSQYQLLAGHHTEMQQPLPQQHGSGVPTSWLDGYGHDEQPQPSFPGPVQHMAPGPPTPQQGHYAAAPPPLFGRPAPPHGQYMAFNGYAQYGQDQPAAPRPFERAPAGQHRFAAAATYSSDARGQQIGPAADGSSFHTPPGMYMGGHNQVPMFAQQPGQMGGPFDGYRDSGNDELALPVGGQQGMRQDSPPLQLVPGTMHPRSTAAAMSTPSAPPASAAHGAHGAPATSTAPPTLAAQTAQTVQIAQSAPTATIASTAQTAPSTRPTSPVLVARSVPAPKKGGGSKLRGSAATLRRGNPEEDAERGVPPLDFPRDARGKYTARRKRSPDRAGEVTAFMQDARARFFEKAKELGEDPVEFLQEAMMGFGFGKTQYWNLFQQFYSMPPGDWDVRDSYDFGTLAPRAAWDEFQKVPEHQQVLDRFGWTFPENVAIKTMGKMHRYFDAVREHFQEVSLHLAAVHGIQMSALFAGQHSETDGGLVAVDLAPNAKKFWSMFGITSPVAGRMYQNLVQHTADMNEIADRIGMPVRRSSLDLERIPKLTNPALHKGWDLGRIWNVNATPWFESANPQIVPVPKRVTECQFLAHLLVCMKNELCIENWPWWIPLPYSPGQGLSADRGLQGYGVREAHYIKQWLDMRDPDDPTRPHRLGLRLGFAGMRTDPETPLPTIRTSRIRCPGSPWHGRVLVYYVATHESVSPTPAELRAMRTKTDEIDSVYGFQHQGKEPKDKAEEEATAAAAKARSNKRRGQISKETIDSDTDASGDDVDAAAAMDVDVPPAAAAPRRTRAQVAAALPPIPLDDAPEGQSAPLPPQMWDAFSPADGPADAYWLPPSGKAIVGFPGGVPDNFSVWTCGYARDVAKPRRWSGYKSALTKARQRTIERIKAGLPAPPMLPINKGAVDGASEREPTNEPEHEDANTAPRPPQPEPIAPRRSLDARAGTAAVDAASAPAPAALRTSPRKQPAVDKEAAADVPARDPRAKSTPRTDAKRRRDERDNDEEDDFAALTNKRIRVDKPKPDRERAATSTPSRRKSTAAAAAPASSTPSRTSAAAAAPAPSTPSRASAAAAGGTPGPSRTPMRQVTVQMPTSRAPTPAPPAAEKQFRAAMVEAPEGPVPDWIHLVPAALEPASVQTAVYHIGLALKRRRAPPEDYCVSIEDLIDLWPTDIPVPDDLRYVMQAVHNRPGAKEVTAPRPAWLKSVPPGFDPRAVQTAVHRLSRAHKLGLPFLEDDTELIKRFVDQLPVQFVLPDDFIAVYDAVAPADE